MTRGGFYDEVSKAGVPLLRPTLHVGAFDQMSLGAGWAYFDSSKDPKRAVSSWKWPLLVNQPGDMVMDFLNEGVAGIYFMEAYSDDRIPVLFVHGMGGYPQEFSTLIAALDRDRFQPWFYFYPSGFALDGLSTHLATLLERLHVKHDFDELAIIGHSMGGLVSHGAILKYEEETERGIHAVHRHYSVRT